MSIKYQGGLASWLSGFEYLLPKHKALNAVPNTHSKSDALVHACVTPILR